MLGDARFRRQPPEFWAVVKLVSQVLGYSVRKRGSTPARVRVYSPDEVARCLRGRDLDPSGHSTVIDWVAEYSRCRAAMLEKVRSQLMDRDQARALFEETRDQTQAPEYLISWNKQSGEKRHEPYLASIVNMLTWATLTETAAGRPRFDHNPRGPLTFSKSGMPLRTLFRWMDGAYPGLNHPVATWEIKEYYGTKTFGSRVADGVYETALDGYELNDLRTVGVEVQHYLFLDDYFTWWDCGRSCMCRIVDMLHADLLDGAFFGREVVAEWPVIVSAWPTGSPSEE